MHKARGAKNRAVSRAQELSAALVEMKRVQGVLVKALDEIITHDGALLNTRRFADAVSALAEAQRATPSNEDVCAACGQAYGAHDGTRCPTGNVSHFVPAPASTAGLMGGE